MVISERRRPVVLRIMLLLATGAATMWLGLDERVVALVCGHVLGELSGPRGAVPNGSDARRGGMPPTDPDAPHAG